MKHKWSDNVCVRCGCTREKRLGNYIYSRTGIVTMRASDLPCIDWEVENAKTID